MELVIWCSALWNAGHYWKHFTLGIGYWFWPTCCVYPVFEGEPPPPISTPWGAYSGAASHGTLDLLSHLPSWPASASYIGRVGSPVVSMNLTVCRWSLMCTNHTDMIANTPAFFTELGTTRIYVECSTAGPSHVSHHGAMLAEWSPIHVLTELMIA